MGKKPIDCLIIHPSAIWKSPKYITIPMGLVGLMNALKQKKMTVKLVNHGLELSLDRNFSIKDYIISHPAKIVAIDLHWHEHAHSSIKIARLAKEINSKALTVLGGFTCSIFAQEIIDQFEFIDLIVQGDADFIFPELCDYYLKKKSIPYHPKIVTSCKIDLNYKLEFFDCDSHFEKTNFTDLSSIEHWTEYLKCSIDKYNKSWFWNHYWLPIARGCSYSCSYCGGDRLAQYEIFNRSSLVFRSVDAIISDLRDLNDMGIHIINFSHDPILGGEVFWKSLNEKIRNSEIEIGLYLETWGLPTEDFMKDFALTYQTNFSTIAITILTGNDMVRKKNGKNYSKLDIFKCLDLLENYKIPYILYFSTGLPFETYDTIDEGIQLVHDIMSKFHPKTIISTTLTLDPYSPMAREPEKYEIECRFDRFMDYYIRTLKRSKKEAYDLLGYSSIYLDYQSIVQQQQQFEKVIQNYSQQFQANQSFTRGLSYL